MPDDEVCKGVCHYHSDRDKLMKEISDTTNQHKGFWKLLLVMLGVALSSIFYMVLDIKDSVNVVTIEIKDSVESISNDVSELKTVVSNGVINHNYNENRLDNQKNRLKEVDNRVRTLEIHDHAE